jgi:hypothetical protein
MSRFETSKFVRDSSVMNRDCLIDACKKLNEFKQKGFTFKSNDKFIQTDEEKVSFFMVGRSKNKIETEPVGQIKFTILSDGTVISDSNYLPDDVNKLAHAAMDAVDLNFSSKRVMTKKEVPLKYRDRINKSKIIQIQNLNN